MEYELKHYYRVKYALICARQSFLKEPPKDDYEKYARKVIGRAYFLVLNKIDELNGTNECLLKYYKENIEKHPKVRYNILERSDGMAVWYEVEHSEKGIHNFMECNWHFHDFKIECVNLGTHSIYFYAE